MGLFVDVPHRLVDAVKLESREDALRGEYQRTETAKPLVEAGGCVERSEKADGV